MKQFFKFVNEMLPFIKTFVIWLKNNFFITQILITVMICILITWIITFNKIYETKKHSDQLKITLTKINECKNKLHYFKKTYESGGEKELQFNKIKEIIIESKIPHYKKHISIQFLFPMIVSVSNKIDEYSIYKNNQQLIIEIIKEDYNPKLNNNLNRIKGK